MKSKELKILEKYTDLLTTNIYLTAAKSLGMDINILDKMFAVAAIRHKRKELQIYRTSLSVNSLVSGRIATNKYLVSKLLRKELDVVPESKLFIISRSEQSLENQIARIVNYVKNKDFSVVIKPNDQKDGLGVTILPQTEKDIISAVKGIKKLTQESHILVENFIPYKNEFRVLVYNNEIIDILRRIPAFVEGDGIHTMVELIEKKTKLAEK